MGNLTQLMPAWARTWLNSNSASGLPPPGRVHPNCRPSGALRHNHGGRDVSQVHRAFVVFQFGRVSGRTGPANRRLAIELFSTRTGVANRPSRPPSGWSPLGLRRFQRLTGLGELIAQRVLQSQRDVPAIGRDA